MFTDLTLPSKDQVLALLNYHIRQQPGKEDFIGFTFDDITFQTPAVLENEVRNTALTITANNTAVFKGQTTVWYNRLNLSRLSPGVPATIIEPAEFTRTAILEMFNELYNTKLEDVDIEEFVIPDPEDENKSVTFVAKAGSYAWIESVVVNMVPSSLFIASENEFILSTEDDVLLIV